MADTKREIERKYESDDAALPDLTRVPGVASVRERGVTHLDATYHDTADHRLAASSLTLRRRTGGADAGWHLKFPVAPGVRDEIRAPSPTPSRTNSPPWSAPASVTGNCCPWSASAPTATSVTSSTTRTGCSPR